MDPSNVQEVEKLEEIDP